MKIRIEGLSKTFTSKHGAVPAVADLSLSIPTGEFCCIVGPSGCGKSTLMRILAGLEKQTSGSLVLQHANRDQPLNSIVFQEQSVFPWMTVEQNIAYGLRMRRVDPAVISERVDYYLRKTGLARFALALPHQLSGGMKQRVSVARAFANDPEILLMDEPFGSVDEQTRILLQDELLKIWEESRKTVVFITHSIDESITLGDRVVVMTAHPGTIKAEVAVDLPRPRRVYELKADPHFGELVYRVWSLLRDEVQRAKAEEEAQAR